MTRKHYIAIADTVRNTPMSKLARKRLATNLAYNLGGYNPRFDRARFLAACGV